MITPDECELLARQTVMDYSDKCGGRTPQDIANVLMKLTSMCGLAMVAIVGQQEATERLIETTAYIGSLDMKAVRDQMN